MRRNKTQTARSTRKVPNNGTPNKSVNSAQPSSNKKRGNQANNKTHSKKDLNEKDEEIELIDSKLKQRGLIRIQIPKDGACLFRSVSQQIYGTQEVHYRVRKECVDYLEQNPKEFKDFTSVPYETYLNEMRDSATWGGQIELAAISKKYKFNIIIYQLGDPTEIDNGFKDSLGLCFSHGNHYDIVYQDKHFNATTYCQGLVLDVLEQGLMSKPLFDNKVNGSVVEERSHVYQNIGWETWVQLLKDQENTDREVALATSQELEKEKKGSEDNQGEFSVVTRRRTKKPQPNVYNNNPQFKGTWNNNKRAVNRKYSGADEDNDADDAIKQVELLKEKEKQQNLRDDESNFPALGGTKKSFSQVPPEIEKPSNQNMSVWSGKKDWNSEFTMKQQALSSQPKFGSFSIEDEQPSIALENSSYSKPTNNNFITKNSQQIKNQFGEKTHATTSIPRPQSSSTNKKNKKSKINKPTNYNDNFTEHQQTKTVTQVEIAQIPETSVASNSPQNTLNGQQKTIESTAALQLPKPAQTNSGYKVIVPFTLENNLNVNNIKFGFFDDKDTKANETKTNKQEKGTEENSNQLESSSSEFEASLSGQYNSPQSLKSPHYHEELVRHKKEEYQNQEPLEFEEQSDKPAQEQANTNASPQQPLQQQFYPHNVNPSYQQPYPGAQQAYPYQPNYPIYPPQHQQNYPSPQMAGNYYGPYYQVPNPYQQQYAPQYLQYGTYVYQQNPYPVDNYQQQYDYYYEYQPHFYNNDSGVPPNYTKNKIPQGET